MMESGLTLSGTTKSGLTLTGITESGMTRSGIVESGKVFHCMGSRKRDLFISPRNRGGVIFSLQFVSVCVCESVCQLTKYQLNECTDLDTVFAKWLLIALARTLLKLVTLDRRSRSL